MTVHFFHGPYRFLSNFYLSTIHWERRSYPTAEHLFQARKTTNEVDHEWVREAPSVSGAKHRGRRVTCRPGWNDIRIDVMREVLEAKFSQHPNLAKKLLETGDQELIEGNFWGDTFWGVYLGSGQNNLGKLLMELRSKTSVYAPRMTSIFSFGSKPELFLRVGMQATLSSRLAVAEALIHRIRHGGDQTFVLEGSLSEEQLKYQTLSGRELKTDYLTHLIYGQIPVIRVWLVREALFDLGVQETLTQALLEVEHAGRHCGECGECGGEGYHSLSCGTGKALQLLDLTTPEQKEAETERLHKLLGFLKGQVLPKATIRAYSYVRNDRQANPSKEGRTLAEHVLTSWGSKRPTIDLQRVPPHLLTSSFFHAFLKFFQDVDPDLLPEARRIQWITEFPFQQELISTFVLEPTFV